MTKAAKTGAPYPSHEAGPVDGWSKAVYEALHDWHVAREGDWTRWEPGYVLLTINRVDGINVEPIQLYTADEELTVEFGYWLTHNPAPSELWEAEAEVIAGHAKSLITQWLNGELRTAVLTDLSGKWCGSTLIEPGDLTPQLQAAAQWVRDFEPKQIEVRTATISEWRTFPVDPEWVKPPVLPPERFPR